LATISLRDKRDYPGLFEEVSLMVEWGLMEREVAHYMFGYHAIMCWESTAFWEGVGKWNAYWARFHDFYWSMKAEQQRLLAGTAIAGDAGASAVASASAAAGTPTVTLRILRR
jgi:hypothetical protein